MKSSMDRPGPPRLSRRVLTGLFREREREHLVGEIDELYSVRLERRGRSSARRWYRWQVVHFTVRLGGAALWRAGSGVLADVFLPTRRFRHALRRLAARPGYAVVAVLTLGIGVGGVATVYSGAEWVLLRPVPGVRDPGSLVTLIMGSSEDNGTYRFSNPQFEDLESGLGGRVALAASSPVEVDVGTEGGALPERHTGELVTADYFAVLGVYAQAGRVFRPADHAANAGPAEVVVSDRLWRNQLDGRPDVVGGEIRINSEPFTVIGVAPRGFRGAELPGAADLWVTPSAIGTVRQGEGTDALSQPGHGVWRKLVGRVSPSMTVAVAQATANRALDAWREAHPGGPVHQVYRVYGGVGLDPGLRSSVRRSILLLAGASTLLLLLAVANVANLSLARAASRRSDSAIHLALGAGRWRIALDSLAESVLIGGGGAVAALLVAVGGSRVFATSSFADGGASLDGMALDWRVVVVAVLVAAFAGLLAGIAPATSASREARLVDLSGRRHGHRGSSRFRGSLVVVQVGLSTMLVVSAALLARSVANLRNIDMGYRPDGVAMFSIDPSLHGEDAARTTRLVAQLRDRLGREPGVRSVAAVYPALLEGWSFPASFYPPGAEKSMATRITAAAFMATPGLLETLGSDVLAGGDFPEATAGKATDEVILSESVVRAAFPGVSPSEVVGRSVPGRGDETLRVIGVVRDARMTVVDFDPEIYNEAAVAIRPWAGSDAESATVLVRTSGPPERMFTRLRAAAREVAPSLPVYDLRSVRMQADRLIAGRLAIARLALTLAMLGLLLAGIGLYGLLAYNVTERRREIGVRAALGAQPASVLGGVVAGGLGLTSVGLVAGFVGAAWSGRLLESRLYHLSSFDPLSYLTCLVVLLAVALLASLWPAWRAMLISPMESLRADG